MRINIMYDPGFHCRIHGIAQDCTANDEMAQTSDHCHDRRMVVLYVVCQPIVLDHEHIQTMCDVDGYFCYYHGTGVPISVGDY